SAMGDGGIEYAVGSGHPTPSRVGHIAVSGDRQVIIACHDARGERRIEVKRHESPIGRHRRIESALIKGNQVERAAFGIQTKEAQTGSERGADSAREDFSLERIVALTGNYEMIEIDIGRVERQPIRRIDSDAALNLHEPGSGYVAELVR